MGNMAPIARAAKAAANESRRLPVTTSFRLFCTLLSPIPCSTSPSHCSLSEETKPLARLGSLHRHAVFLLLQPARDDHAPCIRRGGLAIEIRKRDALGALRVSFTGLAQQ